jgi:hypothetical protein
MTIYGKRSLEVRAEMHPDLVLIFDTVLSLGYDHSLVEAYRNKDRQHSFFIAVPPLSKVDYPTVHNTRPCWAVDAYSYIYAKGLTFDDRQAAFFAGRVMAISEMLFAAGRTSHRLRCGIDWDKDNDINDQTFNDPGHFELIPNPGEQMNYFEN